MKCANCSSDAAFTVTNPASRPVHYCNLCLPKHLLTRASEGHFPLQAPLKTAAKKTSKKKPETEPEVVAEPVEETPQEAPSEDL